MQNKKNIVIVDDHTMFRKGLASLINLFASYHVLFDASNGNDFIQQLQEDNLPDIVLLDIKMNEMDGYATAQWIKNNYPQIKILALSTMDNESAIIRMIKSGAKGYILKDADTDELKEALDNVLSLGYYFNDLVTRKVMRNIQMLSEEETIPGTMVKINEKELTFLKLACSEKTYQQIAGEMSVSERTVDGYRESLFQKLNVSSRVGLVLYAIKNGIVNL